ncbi:hypothetical protein F4861DRAFT_530202 [Xylaria intraflava]|nr:hypothetical protein F4861DRAFT_530202 [Xylaria intraflava]
MEPDAPPYRPPFLRLPIELVLQICEHLSVDDVLALRLVCRYIETFLFDLFCREFFAERRFSITYHSLQVLDEIAKYPRLKNCLTHLTIGLDCFHASDALPRPADHWNSTNHNARGAPLVKAGVDPYKLEAFVIEQNFLISSGRLQLMLSESLSNLSCLEELNLRDRNVPRKTKRDGINHLLVSYGWSKILLETGIDFTGSEPHLDDYDDRFVDMVFSTTLLALAQSRTRLKALTVDISQGNIGLSSSAFSIPTFFRREINPILFNLRCLDLSVIFTRVTLGSYSSRCSSFLKWQQHQLFAFLHQTPNLVTLRVQSKEQGFFPDGIIMWLAGILAGPDYALESEEDGESSEADLKARIPDGPKAMVLPDSKRQFHALAELELGNMKARARTVCAVLRSLSGSLRRLTLRRLALCVKGEDDELDNDHERPNAWSAVFLAMRDMLQLEKLALHSLEHHTPSCSRQNGHPVAFFPSNFGVQSGPANGLLHAWSHEGSVDAVRDFLGELHLKTIILCRKCKEENPGYRSVEEILAL